MTGFFGALEHRATSLITRAGIPTCGKCGLYKKCRSPKMPLTGRGRVPILFVGEAPGEREDFKGEQLIGKSGQLLRKTLRGCNLSLNDCLKTNAIRCYPPDEHVQDVHIESCRPLLLKDLEKEKPKVVVLMGASAVRSYLPSIRSSDIGPISKWVGWRIPDLEHGCWVCPTYHPAYVLRRGDKAIQHIFTAQIKAAVELLQRPIRGLRLRTLENRVERILSKKYALAKLKDLRKASGLLAFDFETNCVKPDAQKAKIYCVSFCLDGETFAFMLDPDLVRPLSKVLRNPATLKVASNLKYEERWTMAKMGHPVASWYWDTMLAAHCLDNRSEITSLKFQAFVQFGVSEYEKRVHPYLEGWNGKFNRVHQCPPSELLLYNGLDSLLEYLLMLRQKELMKSPFRISGIHKT